ncbi:RNase H domain-containing protein [Aphis craccivora]|uniref:RNase H domain-containing protein n=1 Tax=Aphis craccivora TaxID=307492 RepID=A0A6G0Y0G0_APHCR|nr:RNase H domain-containing protein [Aphis craccivora]
MGKTPPDPYNTNKWNLRNPNWTLYSDIIDKTMSENQILNNELNTDDIDTVLNLGKKLINDLTPNTPIKEAWKKIRLVEGIQFNDTPKTLSKGDKTYFSSLEKSEALAEIFEKNSSTNDPEAIELIEQNWKNTKSFLIASDYLSSILAIQNQGTSNKIIKNIQEKASSLAPRSVTFMWIPDHKNIPGNEKADVAAKEASTNINIPKIDLSSFKNTARNALKSSQKIHKRLWDQELENKLYQIKPFLSPNLNPPSSTRRHQVIWTRMKIGHTNITHVHLMRREPRPNCELCNNAPISTTHLFLECPNLIEQRKIFPHLILRDILNNIGMGDNLFRTPGLAATGSVGPLEA